MLKKLSSILLLTFSFLVSSQITRFSYEYKYIPDSTNKEEVKKEIMVLDISKSGSKFYSEYTYKSDSAMMVNLEKQLQATGAINITKEMMERRGSIRYSVIKDYPDFDIHFITKISRDAYDVEEKRKLNWKILPEKEKIGEWNTQKATLDFGGRKWIAWFTESIPFQDGPYKFYGLPGLIVKMEDTTNSHRFELKGIKNNISENEPKLERDERKINISQKQYAKLLSEYEKDPSKGLKQIQAEGIVLNMENSTENQKMMKEREAKMKEKIKKDNNRIELK